MTLKKSYLIRLTHLLCWQPFKVARPGALDRDSFIRPELTRLFATATNPKWLLRWWFKLHLPINQCTVGTFYANQPSHGELLPDRSFPLLHHLVSVNNDFKCNFKNHLYISADFSTTNMLINNYYWICTIHKSFFQSLGQTLTSSSSPATGGSSWVITFSCYYTQNGIGPTWLPRHLWFLTKFCAPPVFSSTPSKDHVPLGHSWSEFSQC